MQRIRIFGLLVVAGFAASGCGYGGPPKLAAVRGKVTLNGKPLAKVRVEFVPEETVGPKFLRSTATTSDDGTFELTCDDGRPGAVPGWHKVVVATIRGGRDPNLNIREAEGPNDGRGGSHATVNLAPYTSAATTQERHEIKDGENDIQVKLGS